MNIKKSSKLKDKLKKLETDPSADKAKIAELQALLYGSGWHTVI
jgi:hypothetical protein